MYLSSTLIKGTKLLFKSTHSLRRSFHTKIRNNFRKTKPPYQNPWTISATIKIQKFHTNQSNRKHSNNNTKVTNNNNIIVPISHYYHHKLLFSNANNGEQDIQNPPRKHQSFDDIPISERPEWVLIGFEDASNVFRLSPSHLKEIKSIRKDDPYEDEKFHSLDDESHSHWYYVRDVFQKSCDIYGAEIVNAWYERFKNNVETKVSYEALYGWRSPEVLPQETPLFKWLFDYKLNEILSSDSKNTVEGGGTEVVKRAIRANAAKLAITYLLYLYTSSYSLWAETLHSVCDVTNQALLFVSIRVSSTDPHFNHPYGYGASRWVVSFLSGTVLFGMGLNAMYGSLSSYLINNSQHIVSDVRLGIALCGVSAILELYSFIGAYREIKSHIKREKDTFTLQQYLAHGTDSTSIHVFLEDGTGLLCSMLAGFALTLTHLSAYKYVIYDVIGSTVIGSCLSVVGLILMLRNGKLLSGRSVQNNVLKDTINLLSTSDVVASFFDLKSMIVGMNTCVIKVEVNFNADKVAEKHIKTSQVFHEFQNKCLNNNDIDAFHDLMMKSCADYQQWVVTERSLIEIGIKQIVKGYGYDRVHVDIETY